MTETREEAELRPFLEAVAESRARMDPRGSRPDPSALLVALRSGPLEDLYLLSACFANLDLLPAGKGEVPDRILRALTDLSPGATEGARSDSLSRSRMSVDDLSLNELRDAADRSVTAAAAVESGVFRGLHGAEEGLTPSELAARLDADPRAVGILLPPLVRLGLLWQEGDRFALTEESRRTLGDPESPEYAGGGMGLWLHNLRAWTRLPDAVATGRPPEEIQSQASEDEDGRAAIARFMAGMAAAPAERVERTVDLVLERAGEPRTLLDVGGGPGHYARAFAERGLRATVLDRPEVIDFVREEYGLADDERIDTVGADFLENPLPGSFDIALVNNVTHMLSPEQSRVLLRKVRGSLEGDGLIVIGDFVRGRSERADWFALIMLLRTEGGNTYTEADYAAWLEETGFGEMEVVDVEPDRQLVMARTV